MRRILRKIAAYKEEDIGDVSTLAEPQVIDVRDDEDCMRHMW